MEFEWDESKAALNFAKHGVSFTYAVRVFQDPHHIEEEDPLDHWGDIRHRVIGIAEGRLLFVASWLTPVATTAFGSFPRERQNTTRYQEI